MYLFHVPSKSSFLIENTLSAFTALLTIFVAYQASMNRESNRITKNHNDFIEMCREKEYSMRVILIFDRKVIPLINKVKKPGNSKDKILYFLSIEEK